VPQAEKSGSERLAFYGLSPRWSEKREFIHPVLEIQKPKPRTTTRPRRDSIFSFLSK
jgi:hypothetical protein